MKPFQDRLIKYIERKHSLYELGEDIFEESITSERLHIKEMLKSVPLYQEELRIFQMITLILLVK